MTIAHLVSTFAGRMLRRRVATLLGCLAFLVLTGFGMTQLQFNPDSRVFFGAENPEMIALRNLEATYTPTEKILFVVAPDDGDVFEPEILKSLSEMTEDAWQIPYTLRVDSITNFNHLEAIGDAISVAPVLEAGERPSQEKAASIRALVLNENELVHLLVSPGGDVTAVLVRVVKPENDKEAIRAMGASAQALKKRWQEAYPEFDFYLTGSIIADLAFEEAGKRDMITLVPLIGMIVFAILLLGLRSLSATIATVVTLLASAASAMGFAGWIGVSMNTGTVGAPVSIMILTLATCIHVLLTWLKRFEAEADNEKALVAALAHNFVPILVATCTTAIGFLCLNFSSSPPLKDLGNIVAFGVLAGMGFCLTLLPCLASFHPPRHRLGRFLGSEAFRSYSDMIIRNRRNMVIVFLVALPVAAFGVSRITLEDDYIRYFGKRYDFRQASEFTERHLTGLNTIKYSLPAQDEGGVLDPGYLKTVDAFTRWLEDQQDVSYVESMADVVKRINQTINGDDPSYYRIEDTAALNAQNLLLYELSLPVGLDLTSLVAADRSHSRVTVVLANVTSARLRELSEQGERWLEENAPTMRAPATGKSVVFAYISDRNIRAMITGTVIALLLISAILLVILRSVKFGIVSLLPNLAPALLAFGMWGYFVGHINLGSSIVTTMTLGIIVDDTVYLLLNYFRFRKSEHLDAAGAIRMTFASVGPAIVLTSFALIIGFLVLATSGFAVNQQIGMLCAITVAAALIADLHFLPAVLTYVDRGELK